MNLHVVYFHTKASQLESCLSLLFWSSLTFVNSFILPLVFSNTISSFFMHSISHLATFLHYYAQSGAFYLLTGSSLLCNFFILLFTNWYISVIYFGVRQYISFPWVACFNTFLRSLLTITALIQLMFNEPKLLVFTFFPFEIIYVNISYICLVKNTFFHHLFFHIFIDYSFLFSHFNVVPWVHLISNCHWQEDYLCPELELQ